MSRGTERNPSTWRSQFYRIYPVLRDLGIEPDDAFDLIEAVADLPALSEHARPAIDEPLDKRADPEPAKADRSRQLSLRRLRAARTVAASVRNESDIPVRLNLSVAAAAESLGISRRHLLTQISRREISVVRIGRRVLVPLASLAAFNQSHSTEKAP